jgi:L-histidine N-alpha-methyltransferase
VAPLLAAYDDAAGVTAAFNKNLLARINRELGADFDLSAFAHRARYEQDPSRMVLELVSQEAQSVVVAGTEIRFAAGEPIRTEYSHKPSRKDVEVLAGEVGLSVRRCWTDQRGWFGVFLLERAD